MMPKRTLGSLGAMVKSRRSHRKLREVAAEIGIGPATLMRVEAGRIPDLNTFGKICNWLKVDPGSFLGFDPPGASAEPAALTDQGPRLISAHLRADRTPDPETIKALATMIVFAAQAQEQGEIVEE